MRESHQSADGAPVSPTPSSRCGTAVIWGAVAGEIIGTGIIGGLVAYPVAKIFLGSGVGAMFFVVPFLVSTIGGSMIAWLLCHTPVTAFLQERLGQRGR